VTAAVETSDFKRLAVAPKVADGDGRGHETGRAGPVSNDDKSTPATEPFEYRKWVHELKRQDAHRAHDQITNAALAIDKSGVDVSNLVLRTCVLINGGAAIALLAFVGNLVSKNTVELVKAAQLSAVADSLTLFALGVAFATLGMGAAYFTHYATVEVLNSYEHHMEEPFVRDGPGTKGRKRSKLLTHTVAVVLAVASLISFLCGLWVIRDALTLQSAS
jgi:hypothetical protein